MEQETFTTDLSKMLKGRLASCFAVLISALSLGLSGCGFMSMTTQFLSRDAAPSVSLRVSGDPSAVEVTEGSSVVLVPTLTAASTTDIEVNATITSGTHNVASSFVQTMPVTVVIPAGETSASVSLNSIANPVYTGDLDFTLTISSPQVTGAIVINLTLKDQQPLTLGTFAVSGVIDTSELTDTTYDLELADSFTPKVAWTSSSFATSYDVSILNDAEAVTVCPAQNTSSLNLAFSSSTCSLNIGGYYKVKVVAKAGAVELPASLLRFRVTSTTVLIGDSIVLLASGSAVTFDPRLNDVDTSAVITSVTTPTAGTAAFTGTSVTYTPAAAGTGIQTFSYTVNSNGNTLTGTVRVKVMTAHTWTGAVSNAFSLAGNWCGSVTTPGLNGTCTGTGSIPGTSQTAILDLTCSANCSPAIAASASVTLRGLQIAANSMSLGTGSQLSITTGGFRQTGGYFNASAGTMSITGGALALTAGKFLAPAGLLKLLNGSVTILPAFEFEHGSGTMQFGATYGSSITLNTASAVFNNVTLYSGADDGINYATLASALLVDGNLEIKPSTFWEINGFRIAVKGNVSTAAPGANGTTVIELLGNVLGQTVSGTAGAYVPGLKLSAGTNPVTFSGNFSLGKSALTVASVGAFSALGNTLTIGFGTCDVTPVIPGNVTYNHVAIKNGCHTLNLGGGTMKIAGNLISDLNGQPDYQPDFLENGTFEVGGNLDGSNGVISTGTASIKLIGNAAGQTVTSGPLFSVPNLEIAAGANNVTFVNTFRAWQSFRTTSVGVLTLPPELRLDGGCNGYGAVEAVASFAGKHLNDFTLLGSCPVFNFNGEQVYVDGKLTLDGGVRPELKNTTLLAAGDVDMVGIYRGNGILRLVSNPSGQTVRATTSWATLPNLEIAAGTNPVTLSGAQPLQIVNSFKYVSAGSYTQSSILQFGINDCTGDVSVTAGGLTFGAVTVKPYCVKVNFLDSIRVNGAMTVDPGGGTQSLNMPNPGTGYTFNVVGTYSNTGNVPFNLYGAVMTVTP